MNGLPEEIKEGYSVSPALKDYYRNYWTDNVNLFNLRIAIYFAMKYSFTQRVL